MIIHFILLIICFFILYNANEKQINFCHNKKKNNFLIFIVFVILVLFLGLRDIGIGTDTVTYVSQFRRNDYSYSNLEFLLPFISKFIKIFSSKYYVYLIVLQVIILSGIIISLKNYKFQREIFIFLYISSFCYLYSASAIRFFCAFSIILISFKFMIIKKDLPVILLILIASFFHTSALCFLPIYYFTKIKLNLFNSILIFIIGVSILLIIEIIDLQFLFNIELLSKYAYVLERANDIGGVSVFINIGILLFSFFYRPIIKYYKEDYEFFIKMHFISIFLDFFSYGYRLIWYFRFPSWFLIPIVLYNLKFIPKRIYEYKILYIFIIVFYSLYYYILINTSLHSHNFLNYKFNLNLN